MNELMNEGNQIKIMFYIFLSFFFAVITITIDIDEDHSTSIRGRLFLLYFGPLFRDTNICLFSQDTFQILLVSRLVRWSVDGFINKS